MAFTTKDWRNSPDTTTPISATALEDLEERVTDYADSVLGGGVELGYASITSDANSTANFGAETDVSGLSVTVTVGSRPIKVIFDCSSAYNSDASEYALIYIKESTTALADALIRQVDAANRVAVHREWRGAPSSGSHTYKIQMSRLSAGTATIKATAASPAFIQVIEV